MNYNDYSMFNRRMTNRKISQGQQLFSAIGSIISSIILAAIFLNFLSTLSLLENVIGGYFDNFILVFVTAIGYNFFSNLVKSILLIVCVTKGKDYNTEPDYQILFFKIDFFAGIAIILLMIISVFTMLSNGVQNLYLNSWAMFIPYGIIGILGFSRIIKSINRIKMLHKLNDTSNFDENRFKTPYTANSYNTDNSASQTFNQNYNNTPDMNSAAPNNYQQSNTQAYRSYGNAPQNTATQKTNKYCSECGMKLQPNETVCPVCKTKVK